MSGPDKDRRADAAPPRPELPPRPAGWSPFGGGPQRYRMIGRAPVAALVAAIALALPASIALAERGQGGTSALPDWAPFVMTAAALALVGWGFVHVARRQHPQIRLYFMICCALPLFMLAAGWWEFLGI